MKRYIVLSVAAAVVTTSALAGNMDDIPFAKTYPMDAFPQKFEDSASVTKVKSVVKKEVIKPAKKVVEAKPVIPAVDYDKKINKLEKSLKKLKKQLSIVKAHDATDNIKWGVDFRTSLDNIEYTTASGKKYKNSSVFANRLLLNMAYAPSKNMIFKGQLSYNKAYGAAPTNVATGYPQRGYGYDSFDWILNENLLDDTVRVKEAYWLYMSDSLFGSKVSWTASFGRRPSTNGFLVSLRDDDKPKSPIGHTINMEFDGASFKFGLDRVTGIDGMSFKLCLGRGLTNARSRFNMDGGFASMGDYTKDKTTLKDIDLAGFIFVPYDNGQYKIMTNYYRGFNVPGFVMADPNMMNPSASNSGMIALQDTNGNDVADRMVLNDKLAMKNLGDMDGAVISFMADGIGDGINDFLDSTKFFASFAWSKSMPDNSYNTLNTSALMQQMQQAGGLENMMQGMGGMTPEQQQGMMAQLTKKEGMMGSNEDETGTSYYVGLQWPCQLFEDAKVGAEYNHGSKYWRPFTYGEDTLIGSKLAARGDAYEFYWTKKLMKSFSMQIRYTKIEYDYTGSQGFFGAGGTPMTMNEAKAFGMDPIEEAQDIRVSFRYRF
jgi:hypothetical protein